MTTLVETAKRLVGKGAPDLPGRLAGLQEAVENGRGRLDEEMVDEAAALVDRSGERLRLSGDHTVVALAGATGSGKSSLFNAHTDLDQAAEGERRPTTSRTLACAWGSQGADAILGWLDVPKRHQVSRDSLLDSPREDDELEGLVLLDLPDHDSTEVAHHIEVERLVNLSDLLVWVLDPQKYADAAIHNRFLRPLATHKDLMLVVLNHIDEVPADQRDAMVADLERLLAEDGLGGVPVVPTSARDGDGVPELKKAIATRVSAKRLSRTRMLTDLSIVAYRMQEANGTAKPGEVARLRRGELIDAFADAAGVPTVVDAVDSSTRARATRATGWPLTSWLTWLKPDPLKRLHLDLGAEGRKVLTGKTRASLPEPTPVQRSRVDSAVRAVSDEASAKLTPPWSDAIRRASVARLRDVSDELDKAVTGTDLDVTRTPVWWHVVRLLQWLLLLSAVGGAVWLGVLAVMSYLRLPEPSTPAVRNLPVPTVMLVGGLVLGVLVGWLARVLVRAGARSRAKAADQKLRAAITEVADRMVVDPIEVEVEAYRKTRAGLAKALR